MDKEEIQIIIDFISGKKQRYERCGECIRCGVCCQEEECEHFVDAVDGKTATCLIFGRPERPSKCTDFPYAPPIVCKTCGYYYYDHLENKKLGYKEI